MKYPIDFDIKKGTIINVIYVFDFEGNVTKEEHTKYNHYNIDGIYTIDKIDLKVGN